MRTFRGFCASCCIRVLHPDSKFRNGWNICLAVLILYCGVAVPLEIAFENDMVGEMCESKTDPHGPRMLLTECGTYLGWFWFNFLIDLWFMVDIYLNFRTGFMHEGHFVADDGAVAKAYLKGSFLMDVLGTFPLNIVQVLIHIHSHMHIRTCAARCSYISIYICICIPAPGKPDLIVQ